MAVQSHLIVIEEMKYLYFFILRDIYPSKRIYCVSGLMLIDSSIWLGS